MIYAGSFSKTLHPNLRVGYAIVPDHLVASFARMKALLCGPRTTIDQTALATFIGDGHYQKHLNRVRKLYKERRNRLLAALSAHFSGRENVFGSSAGLHVAVRLAGFDYSEAVRETLRAEDVGATVLAEGLARASSDGLWLALSYGGIETNDIDPGIARLARTLDRSQGSVAGTSR